MATNVSPPHIYEFGDFRLDATKRLLFREGAPVNLKPRVFETLLYMVEHHDTVLDRERLMEAVWSDSIVEENNLTQNISTLRRVFGETPDSHRFIVTVPGRGYRFVADVRSTENGTAPAEKSLAIGPEVATQSSGATDPKLPARSVAVGKTKLVRIALTLLLICAFIIAGILAFRNRKNSQSAPSSATSLPAVSGVTLPPKSIAVLPFENLSSDPENSYFAAGIQDDVLTNLAQIHDLKVISRTSVMAYEKPGGRNMRAIAQALGVANVLEGSVRRVGNRVLVAVQLIDARNDLHLWAERYDRTVADSIGLQGELATQIAAALKATLAPEEKARLNAGLTTNSEAYVLYLTALGKEATDWEAAEQLHVQAAAIDPKFALAYAHASILNSWFFPERNAKARAQAEEALRLSPKLGEGHVALGVSLFVGEKKYDAALKEFEIATATSPNNAQIYKYVGGIYRRQGRWRDAVANCDRAISLDPLNPDITQFAANNHLYLRDWAAAAAGSTRTLEIKPESMGARITLAYLEVFRNGNPAAGAKLLQNVPAGRDPYNFAALTRWDLAMLERDYAAAEKLSSDLPELPFPKSFYQARTALARGDMEAAQRYFAATTPVLEARVRDHPDDADGHSRLGILYGYMRRKEDAIRESRRAVELEPESRDAFHGALYSASLALVYALVGEEDAAMTLIERLLSTPGAVSYPDFPQNMTLADLRLRWEWDSLRSNPRFQKILAGPEPQTTLTTRTETTAAIVSAR